MKAHTRPGAEWLALGLFAVVVGYQLFLPPVVGLANNGDFGKVLGIFDAAAPIENEYKFLSVTYHFHPKHHIWFGFISSEHLLAAAAILLNTVLSKTGTLDIRAAGAVHAALYCMAFFLLLPLLRPLAAGSRALAYAIVIFVLGDAMYVTWLNTFYMDTAAFIFLLLAAVLYARSMAWRRPSDRIALLFAAMLFASSKTQHCLLALPVAALLLLSGPALGSRLFRAGAALLVAATALLTWRIVPPYYHANGMYSVIFYEITPRSVDLDRELAELGLDASYRRWSGTFAYSPGAPMDDQDWVREFSSRTSYARIGWFLLRHPARAWRALRTGLDAAGRQRPPMGNFAPNSGQPAFSESRWFALWSSFKRILFENRGSRYLFYFVGLCLGLSAAVVSSGSRPLYAALCLPLQAAMALAIAAFADAVEITRHLFLFNVFADLILVSALLALLNRRRKRV